MCICIFLSILKISEFVPCTLSFETYTYIYIHVKVFKICYSPACKKTICHISSPTLNIISLNVCILSSFLTCHLHSNRTLFLSMSPIYPELSCLSAITYGILLAFPPVLHLILFSTWTRYLPQQKAFSFPQNSSLPPQCFLISPDLGVVFSTINVCLEATVTQVVGKHLEERII